MAEISHCCEVCEAFYKENSIYSAVFPELLTLTAVCILDLLTTLHLPTSGLLQYSLEPHVVTQC